MSAVPVPNPSPYMNQLRGVAQAANPTAGQGLGPSLGAYPFQNGGASGYLFAAACYTEGFGPRVSSATVGSDTGGAIPVRIRGKGCRAVPRTPFGVPGQASIAGVAMIVITAGGAGYGAGTTMTIAAAASGDTAIATPILSGGVVVGGIIQNPGGYALGAGNPLVAIAGGGGAGATATCRLATGGWNQPYPQVTV